MNTNGISKMSNALSLLQLPVWHAKIKLFDSKINRGFSLILIMSYLSNMLFI